MKKVNVEKAMGMILAHDVTEIIPGKKKGVAFKRGHVIESGDVEKLLNMGKRHLYVFEGGEKGIHEDEASTRIAQAILGEHMEYTLPKEGKVTIKSQVNGLFYVNANNLFALNRIKDVLVSSLPNRHPVSAGSEIAAARIIPIYIDERHLKKVESVAEKGIIQINPFKTMRAGLVVTGSELYAGRIQDRSSVVVEKLESYGLDVIDKTIAPDDISMIRDAILAQFDNGAELVVTTAGLSVDPDDVTREGIEATGAEVLFYGTPVFPGAMFLVSRLKGRYILGAPACVYHDKYTVLDIILTRIMAGEKMHKKDIIKLSYGGFCQHCAECHYPTCFFGKGL